VNIASPLPGSPRPSLPIDPNGYVRFGQVRTWAKLWQRVMGHVVLDTRIVVVYWRHMAAREMTLGAILSTVERGFAAVASDIGETKSEIREMKSTMATKEDMRAIVSEENRADPL
jgi:hypothetical protein